MKRIIILAILALLLLVAPVLATSISFTGEIDGGGYAVGAESYIGELDYWGNSGELTITAPDYPFHGPVTIAANPLTAQSYTPFTIAVLSDDLSSDFLYLTEFGWPCKGGVDSLEIQPSAVPLTASVWLLLTGLGLLGWYKPRAGEARYGAEKD